MKRWLTSLRLGVETLDRNLPASLVARVLITLAVLAPWDLNFRKADLDPGDLDPLILARARELGVDLLDPRAWPHLSGVLGRIALVIVLVGLIWWCLSRLRTWIRPRLGALPALLIVAVGAIGVGYASWALTYHVVLHRAYTDELPVWGGWVVSTRFLAFNTFRSALAMMTLAGISEVLLLLESMQRLQERAERLALSARMAPHFLFNALNTLRARIEQDPDGAVDLTDRLARVLRRLFQATASPTVPLAQELELVEDYLGLERARLGERLQVDIDVPDALLEDRLPVLGLQVLVENAVKHGVAPREKGGTVKVAARREGRHLVLDVTDPGNGLGAGQGLGAALANLRMRLARPGDLRMAKGDGVHTVTLRYPQGEVEA
jgi:signal transduction histidine kinase